MSKEEKIIIGKKVLGFCIGYTVGTAVRTLIHPNCSGFEKIITTIGAVGVAWAIDEAASKPYYTLCDSMFGTELVEELDD